MNLAQVTALTHAASLCFADRLGDDDDDDDDDDDGAPPPPPPRTLTVEEQLLMREARDGVKKARIFYVEDEEASLEKTAGNQRMAERRAMKKAGYLKR